MPVNLCPFFYTPISRMLLEAEEGSLGIILTRNYGATVPLLYSQPPGQMLSLMCIAPLGVLYSLALAQSLRVMWQGPLPEGSPSAATGWRESDMWPARQPAGLRLPGMGWSGLATLPGPRQVALFSQGPGQSERGMLQGPHPVVSTSMAPLHMSSTALATASYTRQPVGLYSRAQQILSSPHSHRLPQ